MIGGRRGQERRLKVDNKPIGYDKDFSKYVLRHHIVNPDGTIDPVVRVNGITSLDSMQPDAHGEIDEIRKKMDALKWD